MIKLLEEIETFQVKETNIRSCIIKDEKVEGYPSIFYAKENVVGTF